MNIGSLCFIYLYFNDIYINNELLHIISYELDNWYKCTAIQHKIYVRQIIFIYETWIFSSELAYIRLYILKYKLILEIKNN